MTEGGVRLRDPRGHARAAIGLGGDDASEHALDVNGGGGDAAARARLSLVVVALLAADEQHYAHADHDCCHSRTC